MPARYDQLLPIIRDLKPKHVLEIGTWNGDRAIAMMSQTDGVYFGFDLFEGANAETDREESNVKPHWPVERVARKLDAAHVPWVLQKGNTRETLPRFREQFPDIKFDFAYIDGGHSIQTIQSDWDNVRQMMNPDGVVVFDDYYTPESDRFGCNAVVSSLDHEVLPIEDRVFGSELDGASINLVRVNV